MKKLGISFAVILLVIFSIAMVQANSAWAGDYPSEHVFYAPDGVRIAHQKTTQANLVAPQVWTAGIAVTPPAPGMEETRKIERYERTTRHSGRTDYAYCGPKQSNSSESYSDTIMEKRDTTEKKAVFTIVVHGNSGAKETLLTGSAKGFFRGLGEGIGNNLSPWGRGISIMNKLTNAPGPTTITGTNTGIVEGTNTGTVTGANNLTGNLTN